MFEWFLIFYVVSYDSSLIEDEIFVDKEMVNIDTYVDLDFWIFSLIDLVVNYLIDL